MILVKAPLRLSFFGGGSDIPSYFRSYGNGATLSATFNKHVYVAIMSTPQDHVKVAYSTTQYATCANDVEHDIVREALRCYGITSRIEISSFADIPTVGTGLGASSAFNVALVAGLDRYAHQERRDPGYVVDTAANIELNKLGAPIGYQDHIAAAYGGMLFVEYTDSVAPARPYIVHRILTPQRFRILECLFLVQVTAREIDANTILKHGLRPHAIEQLVAMAHTARKLIDVGDVQGFGELLHAGWEEKKRSSDLITTPYIDHLYAQAIQAGVLGGKLLGAGGGGYLLLCAKTPEDKRRIQQDVFSSLVCHNVSSTTNGVEIVYED